MAKRRKGVRSLEEGKNIGHEKKIVNLCKWLKDQSFEPTARLRPALFTNTGRGLQALQNIQQNSVLVRVPIHCCLTRFYLSNTWIQSVLGETFYKCNTQELLAAWLALQFIEEYSTRLETEFWRPYLESLPEDYSLPCTCTKSEISCMPKFLRNHAQEQNENIDSSFQKLRKYFPFLDKQRFKWGYLTVNTRAVYLQKDPRDPGIGEEPKNCLALVPFLDLLNHSDDVSVEAGINLSSSKVDSAKFGGNFYEICVHQSVNKYSETFICYGKHSNSKLLLEYGFFLGDLNSNEHIIIDLEDVLSFIKDLTKQSEIQNHMKKVDIIHTKDLASNLGVSRQGLSWNLKAVIHILLLQDHQLSDWFRVYYIEEFNQLSSIFNQFIASYLNILQGCHDEMKLFVKCSKHFELTKQLVKYHVGLVSKLLQENSQT